MSTLFKLICTLISMIITCAVLTAQDGVSINSTGVAADPSAMLDVESTSKGVLVPRLTTAQRTGIVSPATGLLVFDTDSESFWYKSAGDWVELTNNLHGLQDLDQDTRVQVEEAPDEDKIRMDVAGAEVVVIEKNPAGATRIDVGPDPALIVGKNSGQNSVSGFNTYLGYEAGQNSTTGDQNVFVGYQAGQNNGADQDRNVLIGYRAGHNNNATANTMIGHESGVANLTGQANSFYGYQSGHQNSTGAHNTLLGTFAGRYNDTTSENTFVGYRSGYFNEAEYNTFVGVEAGLANRTGYNNSIIGARAGGTTLNNHDIGDGNAIIGFEAGYSANGMKYNVLGGYRSGYNLTDGNTNVLLGPEAGRTLKSGSSNVAVGVNALRSNSSGFYNVAVGDSALMKTTISNLVAVGTKAGAENTTGPANTFIGSNAGAKNTTGGRNTIIGASAGNFNTTGQNNIFVGAEAASSNVDGDNNTFIGYSSGFKNVNGSSNVFLGHRTGENNIDGGVNIAIGLQALNANNSGFNNIAIGELALSREDGESSEFGSNIGIGERAGLDIQGSRNVIVGNNSGVSMTGNENSILGNDVEPSGMNNTYLGSKTAASPGVTINNSTAIGYGTTLTQNHTVIVGDPTDGKLKVGVGTAAPDAKFHVNESADSTYIFLVSTSGSTALQVNGTQGLSVGTGDHAAPEGLLVEGRASFRERVTVQDELRVGITGAGAAGYIVSVDGNIACEEVRVQDSGGWPDYVFERDYDLRSLDDLEHYLSQNKHLPGVPSASEVAESGILLGDMQKRLLEKVEELTLYILQLERRIQQLEKE